MAIVIEALERRELLSAGNPVIATDREAIRADRFRTHLDRAAIHAAAFIDEQNLRRDTSGIRHTIHMDEKMLKHDEAHKPDNVPGDIAKLQADQMILYELIQHNRSKAAEDRGIAFLALAKDRATLQQDLRTLRHDLGAH